MESLESSMKSPRFFTIFFLFFAFFQGGIPFFGVSERFRAEIGLGLSPAQGQQFPYTATVCEPEAFVRSGPGKEFYPTDKLRNGDAVQVYKHTPDGWCAIRPPLGSFSFVSAPYVEMAQNDLGRIIGNSVPVYVGSRLVPDRTQMQITLMNGRVVEVLEGASGGADAMYKIAPPAGEFRWIHGKSLSPNLTGVTEEPVPPTRAVFGGGAGAEGSPLSSASEIPGTGGNLSGNTAGNAGGNGLRPAGGPDVTAAGSFMYYVNQLDTDLSYILANSDSSHWETEDLLLRANRLMNYAKTIEERNSLEKVRQKIIEADNVRRNRLKFQQILATAGDSGITPYSGDAADTVSRSVPGAETGSGVSGFSGVSEFPAPYSTSPGRWDYSGILVRVQRQTYNQLSLPMYAIVNEDGIVRCYVTPQPGMDLSSYVKKRVTFAGDRNYLREQRAFNLNVKNIVNVW